MASPLDAKISSGLRSVLSGNIQHSHTTLKSLYKDIKRGNPKMTISQQLKVAKTLKKLNDDPGSVMLTNKMARNVLTGLAATGRLKSGYSRGYTVAGRAINKIKQVHGNAERTKESEAQAEKELAVKPEERRSDKPEEKKNASWRVQAQKERAEANAAERAIEHGQAAGTVNQPSRYVSVHERLSMKPEIQIPVDEPVEPASPPSAPPPVIEMNIG